MSPQRTPAEERLRMTHRMKLRHHLKAADEADRQRQIADDLLAELDEQVERESARLGVQVPRDAFLLDLLELIEVEPGGGWLWLGFTNNKGLPTARTRHTAKNGGERSVVRLLAEAFGLIDPDWEGLLYPTNGTWDVNPWHREQRAFPEGKARGNPNRYSWSVT